MSNEQAIPEETPVDAWEQQPNEPELWYDRFHRFLMLGPRRTVRMAVEAEHDLDFAKVVAQAREDGKSPPEKKPPPKRRVAEWGSIAKQHAWEVRAKAYDASQRKLAEREQTLRQLELVDHAHGLGLAFLDKVREMLKFPLTRTTVEKQDEHTTIIVEPVKWTLADAVRLAEMSMDLFRMGAGIQQSPGVQIAGVIHNASGGAGNPTMQDYQWLNEVTEQGTNGNVKQIESRIQEGSGPVQPESPKALP